MSILMREGSQISASWQDLLVQLTAHFGSTAQNRCLLWVDPAQADPFEDVEIVEQFRVRVPIRHPRFDLARAPYVVPLDLSRGPDAELFSSSVELAWLSWSTEYLNAKQGQAICGWVGTEASAKAVARHWGTNCHLHTFQRQSRLLRFQDPGVREWLWPTLDSSQQWAMLGPAREIVSISRVQQLLHHGRSHPVSKDVHGAFPRLHIEQLQWGQIDDCATLHAAWLAWRNSTTSEATVAQPPGWEHPIFRALAHASHLGIRDAVDRELFALHALQLGPDFHRHRKLDEVWPQTQAGEFYGSAVESVIGCPADQLAL